MPGDGHIFISYKSEERDYAIAVRDHLREWGYETWLDIENIPQGAYWPDEIEKGLRECDVVVGLITPESVKSRNVKNEWDWTIVYGEQFNTRLILLLIEPCVVPLNYISINWIDVTEDKREAGFHRLETALEGGTIPLPVATFDDPYRDYLRQLYERINRFLDQKIITSLRDEQNRPEPIHLRSERKANAVLFEKRQQIDPLYQIGGLTTNEPEDVYNDFGKAFKYYGGRVLLLGEPGAGKTITLLQFGRDSVVRRMQDPDAPLPILGIVPTWDSLKQPSMAEWLAGEYGAPQNAEGIIESGRALLLLDGLDELGSERVTESRDQKTGEMEVVRFDPRLRCIEHIPENNQILLTCREQEYNDIGEKIALNGAVTLQPLDSAQMATYLHAQLELLATIQADDDLRQMLETPLLLSFLAFAYEGMSTEERAQLTQLKDAGDLRDKIFKTYIRERYTHEARKPNVEMRFTLDKLLDILGRLAMKNTIQLLETNTIKGWELGTELVDLTTRLNILVKEDQNTYRFVHLLLRNTLAYAAARSALENKNDVHFVQAVQTMGELQDKRAIEPLIAAFLDGKSEGNSYHIAKALVRIGDKRAVEPLIAALNNEVPHVRKYAIYFLGKIRDERAVEPLITTINDENWNVRCTVAEALGIITDRRAVEPLIAALKDADRSVRSHAIAALEEIGDAQAVEPLTRLLSDTTRLNITAFPGPYSFSPAPPARVCDRVAKALENIGTPEAREAVEQWRREQKK